MKKVLLLFFSCLAFIAKAQENASVEKSITGVIKVQTADVKKSTWEVAAGVMGVWINNEIHFSEKFALRNEAGVEMTNWAINSKFIALSDDEPIIPFVLTIEPRFYFLGLNTKEPWFLSLKTSYHPPFLLFSENQYSNISVVPTVAVRKKIGKHITYEVGGGIGYSYIFRKETNDTTYSGSDWAFNIVLRIGYIF